MKVTKNAFILWLIALIAFVAIPLIIPFSKTSVFWVGFISAIIMFLIVAAIFYICLHKSLTLQSKLLGWPIFKVAYYALGIQIVISVLLMCLSTFCPQIIGIIIEILFFSATAACLVIRDTMQHVLSSSENKVINDTTQWKTIRAKLLAFASETSSSEVKKLAEDIRYADPTVKDGDEEIEMTVDRLCNSSPDMISDNIKEVRSLLVKRNT